MFDKKLTKNRKRVTGCSQKKVALLIKNIFLPIFPELKFPLCISCGFDNITKRINKYTNKRLFVPHQLKRMGITALCQYGLFMHV